MTWLRISGWSWIDWWIMPHKHNWATVSGLDSSTAIKRHSAFCILFTIIHTLYLFYLFFTFPSTITHTVCHIALKLFLASPRSFYRNCFSSYYYYYNQNPEDARTHTHTRSGKHTHTRTHTRSGKHTHGGTQALACFCRVYCGLR